MEQRYNINLKSDVFDIIFKNGRLIKNNIITNYLTGKSFEFVMAHYKNKRAKIERIDYES